MNELLQHPSVVRHVQEYLDALSAAGPSGWSTWRMKLPPQMLAQMASVIANSRCGLPASAFVLGFALAPPVICTITFGER